MELNTLADLEGELSGILVGTPLFGEFRMNLHPVENLDQVVVGCAATRVVDVGSKDDRVHLVVRTVKVAGHDDRAALLRRCRKRARRHQE